MYNLKRTNKVTRHCAFCITPYPDTISPRAATALLPQVLTQKCEELTRQLAVLRARSRTSGGGRSGDRPPSPRYGRTSPRGATGTSRQPRTTTRRRSRSPATKTGSAQVAIKPDPIHAMGCTLTSHNPLVLRLVNSHRGEHAHERGRGRNPEHVHGADRQAHAPQAATQVHHRSCPRAVAAAGALEVPTAPVVPPTGPSDAGVAPPAHGGRQTRRQVAPRRRALILQPGR